MNDFNLKLETCPICKGECSVGTVRYCESTVREQNWPQSTYYYINCMSCGTNNKGLVGYSTPEKAAEHWNTRPDGKMVELIKALEAKTAAVHNLLHLGFEWSVFDYLKCPNPGCMETAKLIADLKHSLPETKGENET